MLGFPSTHMFLKSHLVFDDLDDPLVIGKFFGVGHWMIVAQEVSAALQKNWVSRCPGCSGDSMRQMSNRFS
jgi:hypothetical protein